MESIYEISAFGLLFSYFFIFATIVIVKVKKIPICKEILISVIKMTFQLILVGYILDYIFNVENKWLVFLILSVMLFFAILNIIKRLKIKTEKNFLFSVIISMTVMPLVCLILFLVFVVNINPFYEPRYIIPLAGMIFGNSMTGLCLCIKRYVEGIEENRSYIENALSLGATPKKALKMITDKAFYSAIMPTINNLATMGVVSLPGMMTGQILSGTSPLVAIRYQISIMLCISGATALSSLIFTMLSHKVFFNNENQIISLKFKNL